MNINEAAVASECCGSCKYFYYSKTTRNNCCHNKKAIMLYGFSFPERICAANYYKPRNPIFITDLLIVKKLIENAYRAGAELDEEEYFYPYPESYIDSKVNEYIKKLEAGNE